VAQVALFSDKYKTHKYSVGRAYNCWMLNLVVHHVTSRLQKVSQWFYPNHVSLSRQHHGTKYSNYQNIRQPL